jgi:hypothetical protein
MCHTPDRRVVPVWRTVVRAYQSAYQSIGSILASQVAGAENPASAAATIPPTSMSLIREELAQLTEAPCGCLPKLRMTVMVLEPPGSQISRAGLHVSERPRPFGRSTKREKAT